MAVDAVLMALLTASMLLVVVVVARSYQIGWRWTEDQRVMQCCMDRSIEIDAWSGMLKMRINELKMFS